MSGVTVINQGEEEPQLELPPGFRFHPTDEEVVSHYLTPKALDPCFSCVVIADVDLNKCEPWHLPSKAKMGEKEWYFFVHKDRKYPTGMRTNRATESGYWKATGKDKEIFRGRGDAVLIGMKKTLVFYLGRAPRGEKTPWVMHEYRLEGKLPARLTRSAKDEWAVCRVFNKDLAVKNAQMAPAGAAGGMERSDSLAFLDDFLHSSELPALMDSPLGADDFTGASTPAAPDMGYHVKTEQQPTPQQQMAHGQSPCYFSLPAAHGSSGGAGYLHQAATGDQAAALRSYCKAEASTSTLLSPSLGGETGTLAGAGADISSLMPLSKQYLELDDDMCPDPLMDYSNMWKF